MDCFSQSVPGLQTVVSVVQAISAIAIVCLTIWLARSTNTYAGLTRESLEVARRQFEREWLPYWHLSLDLDTLDMRNEVRLHIRNLSRNSARVTHLFLRVESDIGSERHWPFDSAFAGLESHILTVTLPVQQILEDKLLGGSWQGGVEVAVGFVVAGTDEPRPSAWFPFNVAVRDSLIIGFRPKVPYIAREK